MYRNMPKLGPFEGFTPEEIEQLKQERNKGLRFLKKYSLIQLLVCIASITVGVVAIALTLPNPQFPYIIAAPVWSGALYYYMGFHFPGWMPVIVAIGAVCGLLAAVKGYNKQEVESSIRAYVMVHYIFNLLCLTLVIVSMVFSAIGVINCRSSDPKILVRCQPNQTALMAISIIAVVAGGLLCILCMMGTCFFCCYARSLGFKSRRDYAMLYERRMMAMQRQVNQHQSNQVGPAAQGQHQGQGYGQSQTQGQGYGQGQFENQGYSQNPTRDQLYGQGQGQGQGRDDKGPFSWESPNY